jgi:hypothetical protein
MYPTAIFRTFIHENTDIIANIDPAETSHEPILSVSQDQTLPAFYDS